MSTIENVDGKEMYYQFDIKKRPSSDPVITAITELDSDEEAIMAAYRWAVCLLPTVEMPLLDKFYGSNENYFVRVRRVRIRRPTPEGWVPSCFEHAFYIGGKTGPAKWQKEFERLRGSFYSLVEEAINRYKDFIKGLKTKKEEFADPTPVEKIFRPGIVKLLKEADLTTMGKVIELARGESYSMGSNDLIGIPGIGEEIRGEIADILFRYQVKRES